MHMSATIRRIRAIRREQRVDMSTLTTARTYKRLVSHRLNFGLRLNPLPGSRHSRPSTRGRYRPVGARRLPWGGCRPTPVSDRVIFAAGKQPSRYCSKVIGMLSKPCCDDMRRQLEFRCADHADCPDSLVVMLENPVRFGIRVHDGGSSNARISYCPWCGANLAAQARTDQSQARQLT
jgi:hypothetical protein